MRFVGRVVAHHGKNDLSRRQVLQAFLLAEQFAVGRENRLDAHEVELGDSRGTQRQLERSQLLAMPPYALGEKCPLRDRPHLFSPRSMAPVAPVNVHSPLSFIRISLPNATRYSPANTRRIPCASRPKFPQACTIRAPHRLSAASGFARRGQPPRLARAPSSPSPCFVPPARARRLPSVSLQARA